MMNHYEPLLPTPIAPSSPVQAEAADVVWRIHEHNVVERWLDAWHLSATRRPEGPKGGWHRAGKEKGAGLGKQQQMLKMEKITWVTLSLW